MRVLPDIHPRTLVYASSPEQPAPARDHPQRGRARDESESTFLTQFNDLGLAEPLLRAVSAEGYTTPTAIQAQVIPAMLAGGDVLGTAQTGTGKTAAYVLPLLHRIAAAHRRAPAKSCRALVLVPTRELANQIGESIRTYGRFLKISSATIVGGAKYGPQIKATAPGVDIVIATPGRLEDLIASGNVRLDATETLVLDEADQMLDLGFMPAIRRVLAQIPAGRQSVLLSATMPKAIRTLAREVLDAPTEIEITPGARPIDLISQKVVHLDHAAKRGHLTELLHTREVERSIVFTRTKRGADAVSEHLEKAGLKAAAIHGDKNQGQRERTLKAFRQGRVSVLVATDVAARGIDVDDVSHVINYELPEVPEAYVHRIGRTGRAGKAGAAISLCDRKERGLLRDIERLIGTRLAAEGDLPPAGAEPRPAPRSAGRGQSPRAGGAGRGGSRNDTRNDTGRPAAKSRSRPERRGGEAQERGLNRMLAARRDQ